MRRGVYVYGIVGSDAFTRPIHAVGVNGSRAIGLLVVGDLAAVIGEVDVEEFEGEALERNASQPGWLEEKVRAHESVLEELIGATSVVPMRFGSIFTSADAVTRMLLDHAETLAASLERVRGRSEWGVKVYADAARPRAEVTHGDLPPVSGRDYLMRRSAQQKAREAALREAAAVRQDVHAALAETADASAQMAIRAGETGSPGILNGAYLVRDEARDEFMDRVQELQDARRGDYLFEVTGPWPPYNFTSADVAGPRS